MPRQLVSKAIQVDQISLEHCDWYSQDATAGESTGALKLPRGNTAERPTTSTGGRENVIINLTVSQPDVPSTDPNFLQMDPWMWSWEGNYNRAKLATPTTVTSGNAVPNLTLFRGSKYHFANNTVGHKLWLRSAEKTDANDPENVYALGADEGVTGNGAIKANAGDQPAYVEWVIPKDYPHNVIYVQHSQTGMVNTIPVHNMANETLGYMRLNTDIGHDADTKTGLEVYTGTGWKTIPFEDNAGGTKDHPTGTLTTDDNGTITDSVASSDDAGLITTTTTSGDEDFANLLVTAFLPDGDLSVNNNTIVLHDGATGGGIEMMRGDMANLSLKRTNNTTSYYVGTSQTYTQTNIANSAPSRIAYTQSHAGHGVFTLEDGGKRLRVTADINTNTWIKFIYDVYCSTNQAYIDFRKNGTSVAYHWMSPDSQHNQIIRMFQVSYNDVITIHAQTITGGSLDAVAIGDNHLYTELVGS